MTGVLPLSSAACDGESTATVRDGDLARAAAEGDRQAFAEIYDRYADRLYDFCVGLIGDRDAAADCVQDAFCVAATDLGDLREPDKLRPWLYSIARHHAMRRLRHRYREEVSDEMPDMASHEAGPETRAGQSELARLVAEAAGGLSDRDRELLDLSYRHGLDGPELAEALGVTLTSANTMMFRLRQTVERCLGALLVAREAQGDPHACPGLAPILNGWDGQFSVLMRKRMARHIDSCGTCEQSQRQHVNPVALLGSATVFIPAPEALRRQTMDRVQLTSASSGLTETSGLSTGSGDSGTSGPPAGSRQGGKRRMALVVGIPLLCLGLVVSWFARPEQPVYRMVDTGADSRPLPVAPVAVKGAPTPARQQPTPTGGTARTSVPTSQAQTPGPGSPGQTSAADDRSQAPAVGSPGAAPDVIPPNPGPTVAPRYPASQTAAIPNSDAVPNATSPGPPVDTAPDPNPAVTPPDTPVSGVTGSTTGGSTTGGTTTGGTTTGGTTTGGTTTGGTTTGGTKLGTTPGSTTSGGTTSGGTKPGSTTSGGTTSGGTTSGGTTSGGTTSGGTTSGGTTSGGTKTGSTTSGGTTSGGSTNSKSTSTK